ncbi:unnamed protein product, partial [Owenia fusiformis]
GVYYQTYNREDANNDQAQNMLDLASRDVSRYTNNADFEATWMAVVTWKEVYPYPHYCYQNAYYYSRWWCYYWQDRYGTAQKQTVNHQTVLVTDGMRTYSLFHYGEMSWKWWKNANIGYDAGDDFNYFHHYLYGKKGILDISRMKGNTGLIGGWIFRLDLNGENKPNFGAKCVLWAIRDIRSLSTSLWQAKNEVQPCPCMVWQAWRDRRFRMDWWSLCAHQRFPSRHRHGQMCCYNNDWWTDWRSWGTLLTDVRTGAGHFERYHYRRYRRKHKNKDILPRYYCCEASNYCLLFTSIRPVDTCRNYRPPRWTWFWGDPHVRTLDGKTYTFNGLGEYTLIQTTDDYFTLQGRTSRAVTSNGTITKATVFTAFAVKDELSDKLYVQLADNLIDMIVLVNGVDVTSAVEDLANEEPPETLEKTGLSISVDTHDHVITAAFASGFSLNISVAVRSLSVTVTAPVLTNTSIVTKGLMGTMNGDTSDDFTKPDGTVLSEDSNDKEIYSGFGELWRLTQDQSIFWYPNGSSTDDFSDASFEPLFLSDFTQEQRDAANTMCRSEISCVFDYLATGEEDVANATLSTNAGNAHAALQAENFAPQLSVDLSQNFTVGSLTEFAISVSDNDSSIIYVIPTSPLPDGAILDNDTRTFSYTPKDLTPSNLSFLAEDDLGARSPEFRITVWMCTNCSSGQGECEFGTEAENQTESSDYFMIPMCDCFVGWEGDDCEIDLDGCEGDPCGNDSICYDMTPEEQQINGTLFNCSSCPDGHIRY